MSRQNASYPERQTETDPVKQYEETIEALRRAEQKYRSIFENATEGIFQTTPDGHYLSANPALARMYGYDSPEELLAALTDISRQLYVQPARRAEFTLAMQQYEKVLEFESQIYRRDGSIIWISENARAVHDEVTGELLYYEGMVQDITRRKCAEEARERAENHLASYAAELRSKNLQLEADLEMARDIQQVFLTQKYPSFPRNLSLQESWLAFCHWYQPAEQVGGDFFCVLPLSDTEAGVFICDVLGHGLRAALVTAIVRGLLEELTPIATDPGRLLSEINSSLLAIFRQTETPMLVSAFYLVVNTVDGKMCYANAGHPRPFHVRRHTGVAEPLPFQGPQGPVLGIFERAAYHNSYAEASANDLVVLFTDGLFEVEMADDDYYGAERLLAAVRKRMHLPAGQLFAEVVAEIQHSCVSGQFTDDMCLLGVELRRTGLADS
ncbi:MAG: SpoIIE family protein phosphatase, partial [Verrucomicrobia bacterium]|nr:SpoIIE family protein phosphatase [Verrucomicrobiota bacterium]